jgi:hypothetical protein
MQLAYSQQVLAGDLPNRDFVDPGMPLTYALSALVQWVQPGPYSELLLTCTLLALTTVLVFVTTTTLTGSIVAGLAAAFFALVLKPHLYSYTKVLAPAATLLVLQHYLRAPSAGRIALLGIWTAVATLFRYDLGVYAVAGIGAGLLAAHWRTPGVLFGAAARYAAVTTVALLPYAAFLQWTGGVDQQLREAVEYTRADEHQLSFTRPEFPVLSGATAWTEWSYLDSAAFLYYAAHLAVAVALVLLAWRWRAQREYQAPAVLGTIAILAIYLAFIVRHPVATRLLDVSSILAIAGAWITVELVRGLRAPLAKAARGPRLAAAVVGVAAVAVLSMTAVSAWTLARVGENLVETRVLDGWEKVQERAAVVKARGETWPWTAWWPNGTYPEQVIDYVDRCTAPTDRLFMSWPGAEYYFFTRRPFAGGHAWMLAPRAFSAAEHQQRTVSRLAAHRVPVVLINESRREEFRSAYALVDDYLQQHYGEVGRFTIYDGSEVAIATRRGLPAKSTDAATNWPCQF